MVSEKLLETEDKQHGYELVLIISPEVESEALNTLIDNVSRFITEKGGVISQVEQWGKRKLAYPIAHFMEGHYVLIQFKTEPTSNKALEDNMKISEEILRYLLTKSGS